jgi:hypothetical protein
MNDIPMVLQRNMTGPQFEAALKTHFDTLYREAARDGNAKVMAIALHPYITGQPHRSPFLDRVLEYITNHEDVWHCTGSELADYFIDQNR